MLTQQKLVEAALQDVAKLRARDFAGNDDAVLRLLNAYADADSVADYLQRDLPANYRVEDVADLLSLWCWRTGDNSAMIMRAVAGHPSRGRRRCARQCRLSSGMARGFAG